MSKVPLHCLPGFIAAARLGNLSRAAASLHVTVSALSHQMRGLEEQLQRKLFERGRRGLVLTDAGEQLFAAVASHYDALEGALRPERERNQHSLVLSLMPSMASSWLMPRLGDFVAANPEIELSIQSTTDLVDFDREAVDAAMRYGSGAWPGVRAELLFDELLLPVAAPSLVARFSRAERRELSSLPLLRDPADRWRLWFDRFGGTPPKRYVASFDNAETLHRAAIEGMGVALGRLTLARTMLDTGRLVALSAHRLPADRSHYLVYPPRSEKHPALLAFRAWLLDAAARFVAAKTVSPRGRTARSRPPRRASGRG